MDPRQRFVDQRMLGVCAYCGAAQETRDHVPSRVLLEEPFPQNIPVVESCESCNQDFSQDEEYLACFIDCVVNGTTNPEKGLRPKVARILESKPALAQKIASSKTEDQNGKLMWQAETERVKNVVLKLARGHMAFELSIQQLFEPTLIEFAPFPVMSAQQREIFESDVENNGLLFPEIGSRAFISTLKGKDTPYGNWHVIQEGLYRYSIGQSSFGDWVKFVLSEYLACRVAWQ